MLGRRDSSKPAEDPSVARVEELLEGAAGPRGGTAASHGSRPSATHALWICACVTVEDAPVWLIYEDMGGEVVWGRIPDGAEASGIVDARLSAGGHADPGDVLAWLEGQAPDPWAGGDGWGDDGVLRELGRKIRRA